MNERLDFIDVPHHILDGPVDVGTEQRWTLQLEDGRRVVVGQLAVDLARDTSIRRRYVRDVERHRSLGAYSLVPILETGPRPDALAPGAAPPWRMRLDPDGRPLSALLARAPLPLEEFARVFASIADALHAVHVHGMVLRDLKPEQILSTHEGHAVLIDVGLARVDVLSSHTASSLMLQGSSYISPEQLTSTTVDQRSDVYALGVMMWQALTGELPFGDGPPLLVERHTLPSLCGLRSDVPPALDQLVRATLAERASERPASVSEIAWVLRGGGSSLRTETASVCQHCNAQFPLGQRLCLACGRVSVRFEHIESGEPRWSLDLVSLSEDSEPLRWLQDFLQNVSRPPVLKPEFIIGSIHLYSEEERIRRIRLPARLYDNLSRETAQTLHELMAAHGIRTRIVAPDVAVERATRWTLASLGVAVLGTAAVGLLGGPIAAIAAPGAVATLGCLGYLASVTGRRRTPARFLLRPVPAALPASDPLVARLAALLDQELPADVRAVVSQSALLIQRLVDHRARLIGEIATFDLLTQPVDPLVRGIGSHAHELARLSSEIAELDEGTLVRALGAAEARGDALEKRNSILEGLDRLRVLEDRRTALFNRLLEAKLLLERTVHLGLGVHESVQEHERQLALALATLGESVSLR